MKASDAWESVVTEDQLQTEIDGLRRLIRNSFRELSRKYDELWLEAEVNSADSRMFRTFSDVFEQLDQDLEQ